MHLPDLIIVTNLSKLITGSYKLIKNFMISLWDRMTLNIHHFSDLQKEKKKGGKAHYEF